MSEPPEHPPSRGEHMLFALVLVLLTVVVLVLADAFLLVTRPFWVDELIAVMIANRPSPGAVLGDLASGADGGASLLHLGLWLVRVVAGTLTPMLVRLLSLASVLGALALVFPVLRRRFPASAAVAGALAVGAHALVIEHAYEGRFYGPWLLSCAALAWLFGRRQVRATRGGAVAMAAVAFAMCTIHFYGVLTLGLMSAAVVALHGREWRRGWALVRPATLGLAALLVVAPLAIAQRVAYSVPSWLPDFRPAQLASLLSEFWLAAVPLGAAVLIIVVRVGRGVSKRRDTLPGYARSAALDPGIVSLASLALLPFVLGALSIIGQPSMLPRYAIPASLVWAPWTAMAVAAGGRWAARVTIVLLAWFWFVGYTREARTKTAYIQALAQASSAYREGLERGGDLPIVFPSMNVMYPVVAGSGGASRARFLEVPDSTFHALFPDSTPLGQANRVTVLERDLARVHAMRLGFPRLLPQASADTMSRFLLLLPPGRIPTGFTGVEQYARVMFPSHAIRRLLPDLSMLERSPGQAGTAAGSGKLPAELQKAAQSDAK